MNGRGEELRPEETDTYDGEKLVTYVKETDLRQRNPVVTITARITRATQRLGELKAMGIQLSELLGGEAGRTFIRDDCDGNPEVAYAAIALAYYPRTYERIVGKQGEADGS
jgi:hypothetical protein